MSLQQKKPILMAFFFLFGNPVISTTFENGVDCFEKSSSTTYQFWSFDYSSRYHVFRSKVLDWLYSIAFVQSISQAKGISRIETTSWSE
jgi:hypothetical protein